MDVIRKTASLATIVLYAVKRVTVALDNIVVVGLLLLLLLLKKDIDLLLNRGKRLHNDKVNLLMSFIYW